MNKQEIKTLKSEIIRLEKRLSERRKQLNKGIKDLNEFNQLLDNDQRSLNENQNRFNRLKYNNDSKSIKIKKMIESEFSKLLEEDDNDIRYNIGYAQAFKNPLFLNPKVIDMMLKSIKKYMDDYPRSAKSRLSQFKELSKIKKVLANPNPDMVTDYETKVELIKNKKFKSIDKQSDFIKSSGISFNDFDQTDYSATELKLAGHDVSSWGI